MFARFVTFLPLASLAAVAAAAPNAPEARTIPTCYSGSVYCCDSQFFDTSDYQRAPLSITGLLLGLGPSEGIECTPIFVFGPLSDGVYCTQQTACCTHNVKIACTPIDVAF